MSFLLISTDKEIKIKSTLKHNKKSIKVAQFERKIFKSEKCASDFILMFIHKKRVSLDPTSS
jgi:hypothetical protein